MANHGYVTTKRHMSVEKVDADLRNFVQRLFGDLAIVEGGAVDWPDGTVGSWLIKICDKQHTFTVWLNSRRKAEFRHPLGLGVERWAQELFQNELADKYNGMLSDDGVPDRWVPDTKRYDTYLNWLGQTFMMNMSPELKDKLIQEYLERIDRRVRALSCIGAQDYVKTT